MNWKMAIKFSLLIPVLLVMGCGGLTMRRAQDTSFDPSDFSVASMNQDAFRHTSGVDLGDPVGEYAGLTSEQGTVDLVAEPEPGCYIAVATSESALAEVDVAAVELDGTLVNSNLERNDSYHSAGMAVRGFCLVNSDPVAIAVASSQARSGFVLALYRVQDADVVVGAVTRLQNIERRGMTMALQEIIRAADPGARQLAWNVPNLPSTLREGQTAVLPVPSGAAPGACVAVTVTGAGGNGRDIDLYIHTGERPSPETMLAADDRVNPNAAAAFTVPADPATVKIAVQSYKGSGPVAFAAWSVNSELCGGAHGPIPIPGASN